MLESLEISNHEDVKMIGVSSIDSLFRNIKIDDKRTEEESTLARRHPHNSESENLVGKFDKNGFGEGQERFRVARIVRNKPYLVAAVQWLEDRPPAETPAPGEDAEALAVEVEALMRDVIRIANRLNGKPEKEVGDLRRGLFPTPFSFYVGNTFEGAPREQQALLELEDTAARLRRERDTLRNTLNYLTAASAVKDVFPSSPSSG
ncbi:hypothetical protein VPH35_036614 [Triticum aestivum]|uniref:Lon N-terminal domain-containing protein n=1 Tax=Aegilops tauschii TaxID=37682 RepID=M8D538_AEGTA